MVSTRFAVAIHILLLLACTRRDPAATGPVTSHFIAASVNTNPVVVRRLTGQLARAGLVRVRRGPGGAELLRSPATITLADIWTAVTARPGTLLPLHACPNQACPIGSAVHAVLQASFTDVERSMLDTLARTTLADLVAALPGPTPARTHACPDQDGRVRA